MPADQSPAALSLHAAVALIEAGQLVAFPTETVYGLGADATNDAAVDRIFAVKGRPAGHPLIVHLAAGVDPARYFVDRLPPIGTRLIETFWPGPLTLILARQTAHAASAAAKQPTIGVRCPDHVVAQALLGALAARRPDSGLAAPSANLFGHVSPTTAEHVRDEFGAQVPVLDGGPCRIGIESTILDLSRYDTLGAVLLRPGEISRARLAEVLGAMPLDADGAAPRVSGSMATHYAPNKPLYLIDSADIESQGEDVAVWSFHAAPEGRATAAPWLMAPRSAAVYAISLYAVLRALDQSAAKAIVIERPPMDAGWEAVQDRLRRAATPFA